MNSPFITAIMEACKTAGDFQLQHFRSVSSDAVSDKGLNQLVSFVDVESEKILVQKMQKIRPEAGFITEENTAPQHADNSAVWIIDPLDGTTNFLHGLQVFSISVALMENGEITAGVVYAPAMNEMFCAEKGKGAYLNNHPIRVSETRHLKTSLIATGFPYYEFQQTAAYLALLGELMKSTHGLRRMGSAAIDLAYTACGRFDGFYETGLNAWDVAAGALLVEEAGGLVSDFHEQPNHLFGRQILAANPHVYQELQPMTRSYLG
ncbi:MAG: inositol monophosphatase family protein [Sphingomonadales bacterium]|jgi:myo-inositol-1(or 4)-monophosphatase